jgi:hypothetical protein
LWLALYEAWMLTEENGFCTRIRKAREREIDWDWSTCLRRVFLRRFIHSLRDGDWSIVRDIEAIHDAGQWDLGPHRLGDPQRGPGHRNARGVETADPSLALLRADPHPSVAIVHPSAAIRFATGLLIWLARLLVRLFEEHRAEELEERGVVSNTACPLHAVFVYERHFLLEGVLLRFQHLRRT